MPTVRYFHGTSQRRARRIRDRGFLRGGETFLTDHRPLAADYADLETPAVLTVDAELRSPLELDAAASPVADQLRALGFPFEAAGAYLSPRTIRALTDAGHDALVITYPADTRDPSSPMPAHRIVRAFDPSALSVAS